MPVLVPPTPVFAIVTPFEADGAVCLPALDDQLDFLAAHGVQAIISGGTTGEFASLTAVERRRVFARCRQRFPGTILAHVSACAVDEVRALITAATDHADYVLVLPPFYVAGVADAGLSAWFAAACADSPLPVFLYNFPRHCGNAVSAAVIRAVDQLPLAGYKDSGGDLDATCALKQAFPRLQVYYGGDGLAAQALGRGLDGAVTGGGVPVPEYLVALSAAHAAGDAAAVDRHQGALRAWSQLRKALGCHEIAAVKAGLHTRLGTFPRHCRAPLCPPDDHIQAQVDGALAGMGC